MKKLKRNEDIVKENLINFMKKDNEDHIVSCIYCFERIDTEIDDFDVTEDNWAVCTHHKDEI